MKCYRCQESLQPLAVVAVDLTQDDYLCTGCFIGFIVSEYGTSIYRVAGGKLIILNLHHQDRMIRLKVEG